MKKRVLSALLALCLTLSLAGAAFAENEHSGDSSSAVSQAVSSVESEPQTQDEMVSSGSASGEDQTAAKTESTPAPTETPAASDVTEEEPESTPEPEAATEPDTTPAPTEDPVADVTENEESDGSVEYTAALETDGETMNVIVTAPEGAFAEGVQPKLSVTMLTAEDELNAVADKLDTAEVQYDGFAALDITFTDEATGEEVEPVKSVAVRIELPQAIVDSGIDLTTLAVQHLEEDENGNVQNVTEVATLDNGITLSEEAAAAANEAAGVAPMSNMPAEEATAGDATETPAAVAEFEVDGFSSFTITWEGTGLHRNGTIEVTYWNTEGNGSDLAVPDQYLFRIDKLNDGDSITLQNGKLTVNNREYEIPQQVTVGNDTYEYIGAKCYYDNRWKDFTTIKASQKIIGWNYKVDDHGSGSKPDIRLLYRKVDSSTTDPGGTTVTNATVTTTKTADLRDDGSGNYDLTLSISGDRGSSSKKQKVDILFILDKSGSMNYSLNEDEVAGGGESSRMDLLQKAVSNLVDTVEQNDSIDARYGAVAFARSQQRESKSWTNASSIKAFVENLNPGGGTNYQQGIYDGKQLLNGKRAGALTFVIFVSDGEPTYRGINVTNSTSGSDSSSSGTGNGQNDSKGYNIAAAVNEISTMTCDYFYAIGMGPEFGQDERGHDKTGTKNLKNLANAVHATSKGDNNVFSASATDTLEQAFKDIAASVIFFAANDVTITDPLSNYADIVLNADGYAEFTITVTRTELKDDEGEVTSEAKIWTKTVEADESLTFTDREEKDVTVTPAYDEQTKTITLTFPHSEGETLGYELEPGYTYSISTVITPSETAKKLGMNDAAAQQTPDDNTGTHSVKDKDGNKQQGFWSNDNEKAKVTFTANGEPGAQAFPKPVIQVTQLDTGNLTISKQVGGDATATDVANQTFSFTITAGSDVNTSQLKEGEFTVTGGVQQTVSFKEDQNDAYSALLQISGTGNATIVDLPVGTYTVTETQPTNLQNFTFDTTTDLTDSGTVSKDVNSTVTITNKYHRLEYELTVSKIVGGGMGDTETEFDFTVTLTDTLRNNGAYSFPTGQIPEDLNAIPEQDGVYSFQLSNGDRVVIPLPAGVTAVVAEDTTEHPDYTVTSRKYVTPEIGNEITETTYPFNGGDKQTVENINDDYTVDFKNVRPTVAPTGLEDNHTKPFGLMVGVAVMAGLALAGGAVVRRRRRWME